MMNLYPKGKGRIHPSPSGAAGTRGEELAELRLLPAAILALTAALGNDDKEVLAYLIMRSINLPDEGAEQRRCGRPGELHTSLFGCGCFDCYTNFWSRWDCSPNRMLIHQAIEAFEEYLTNSERPGGTGKGRRRERRTGDLPEKAKRKGKDKGTFFEEKHQTVPIVGEAKKKSSEEEREEVVAKEGEKGDRQKEFEAVANELEAESSAGQMPAAFGDRRKGWADVTAIFNSRLWSLWNPGD